MKLYLHKSYKVYIIIIFALLVSTSCTRNPQPPEGSQRCNIPKYLFMIDYPTGKCNVSTNEKENTLILSIADKDNNYLIEILALKATEVESKFEFKYFTTLDTLYYNLSNKNSESKNFFTDIINRSYTINEYVTMETKSIYGGRVVYVIYSKFNEDGAVSAKEIVDTFKSSSTGGLVNFCKRKIYSLLGVTFGSILCYIIFSLGFTLLFWGGLYKSTILIEKIIPEDLILSTSNFTQALFWIVVLIPFLIFFGYIAVHDEFMGYIYGHNNIILFILSYLLLFLDEG